jgi:glycosyltransferase involved in cell wall biosynthesis
LLVSVIVPTYNRREFLAEAVRSVQVQSWTDRELIVVDDGSTDGTPDLAARDGIHIIRTAHSGRPGRVRNIGAEAASGEYLAFLDSDDLWKPEKLARQMRFFEEHPDIPLCHTREVWIRDGRVISQSGQRHKREGDVFADALRKCIIGPSTAMLTRKLFAEHGGFHEELEIAEDYELWLRICDRCDVGYINEPLVIKRGGHPDQLSAKYGQIEIFRIHALRENVEAGRFRGEHRRLALQELARKCLIYAAGCRKRGKEEEARRYREAASRYEALLG